MVDPRPAGDARQHDVREREMRQRELRERTVSAMVSAALLAVLGTLIFAWALRAPEYPWLFVVGAVPWGVGLVMFAAALWRYTRA